MFNRQADSLLSDDLGLTSPRSIQLAKAVVASVGGDPRDAVQGDQPGSSKRLVIRAVALMRDRALTDVAQQIQIEDRQLSQCSHFGGVSCHMVDRSLMGRFLYD